MKTTSLISSLVASLLGLIFLLAVYPSETLGAVPTPMLLTGIAPTVVPPTRVPNTLTPPSTPPSKDTPTPTPLSGGIWSDDFTYSKQFTTMDKILMSESRLALGISEYLDWVQTWDAHFATGEFWQTVAVSDSVQLAPNGPNQFFTTGIYTSTILDAARPVDWASARWLNSGTYVSVTVEFRTGNTSPVDASWSVWSAPKHIVFGDLMCLYAANQNQTDCTSTLPEISSSRYLQYRVNFINGDPTTTLTFYQITLLYGLHPSTGSAISIPISPIDLRQWQQLFYTSTVPISTALTIDVLANDDTVLLPNVHSGDSLASIDPSLFPSLKLRATFVTDDLSRTPELDLWGVRWQVGRKYYYPMIVR